MPEAFPPLPKVPVPAGWVSQDLPPAVCEALPPLRFWPAIYVPVVLLEYPSPPYKPPPQPAGFAPALATPAPPPPPATITLAYKES